MNEGENRKTLDVLDIPLNRIQEKTLVGSYYKGVIPIRSASFSSSTCKGARIRRGQTQTVIEDDSDTRSTNMETISQEESGEEKSAKRKLLLERFEKESQRLTRALSDRNSRAKSASNSVKSGLPESLDHLHLETQSPVNVKVNTSTSSK
jgi:hypothetical protein